VIDRGRCIAWEQNKLCLICDEICPTDAIEFKVVDYYTGPFKRPFIDENKCSGCGLCENRCPVAGRSAVEVFSIGEERKTRGSYITPEKRKLKEVKDNAETSYDAEVLGSGGENLKNAPKAPPAAEESLPPGFLP
jgi:formate hydrogenlyase subunit 6/NADH:ubiquinone oxidoreductase subunit I